MRTLLLAAVAAVGALAACNPTSRDGEGPTTSGGESAVLRFSAIPDQNTTELKEKYAALAAYLSSTLGIEAEFVPATDYAASVEMFKNGDIQLAWFGGLTGVQARAAVPGAQAIAQGKEDPEYFSYFVANAATGLERSDAFPAGIKDLKFTFGSESSTSGRLMPSFFIIENTGSNPEDWFTQPLNFSGSHDKTAKLVESGQFEAGVLSYTTYDKMVADGTLDPAKCRIVWKTPFYADYNFTAHPALETMFGAGFIDKLQAALVAIDDRAILDAFPREAIIPAKNGDFDGIVKVATELGFIR